MNADSTESCRLTNMSVAARAGLLVSKFPGSGVVWWHPAQCVGDIVQGCRHRSTVSDHVPGPVSEGWQHQLGICPVRRRPSDENDRRRAQRSLWLGASRRTSTGVAQEPWLALSTPPGRASETTPPVEPILHLSLAWLGRASLQGAKPSVFCVPGGSTCHLTDW